MFLLKRFVVADLLNPPPQWSAGFDFVLESYTVQALPRSLRASAIERVASLVAPGGDLLVICRGREDDEDEGSLPWPLSHAEIDSFQRHGLKRTSFENYIDTKNDPPTRRFRALFQKPGAQP